jgi:hypothetical protein
MSSVGDAVSSYFKNYEDGDASLPERKVLSLISRKIDDTMQSVLDDFSNVLGNSPEHIQRVQALSNSPRLAGKYKVSSIKFADCSEFEQMMAVRGWLEQKNIRSIHTLFFAAAIGRDEKDDYIPVYVNAKPTMRASTMHVVLGSTRGAKAAPRYDDMAAANSDPKNDPRSSIFLNALSALEVVRQFDYASATIIKDLAYKEDVIDYKWRFGSDYSCVEAKGQSKPAGAYSKKYMSAAKNTCAIVKEYSTDDDPLAEECVITPDLNFEDYSLDEDQYRDDLDVSVSGNELMKSAKKAIINKNDEDLKVLMQNLAIHHIGQVKSPLLARHFEKILLANDKGE